MSMKNVMRGMNVAGLACALTLLLAPRAPAQLSTNYWATLLGGNWSTAANWSSSAIPNASGALVYLSGGNDITGFSGTTAITFNQNATLGYLLWGALVVGRNVNINDSGNRTLTFDTGDGKMALLSHGSGELNRNHGADADATDVRILVTDPQGLYIESFYNMNLTGGANPLRALDGGGNDIVKAEDGYLLISRIVTNVNNLVIRDGTVRFNYDNLTNLFMRSDITNVVLGAPGGAIDTGTAHPFGVAVTNFAEGGSNDRTQMPWFEVYGINNTNSNVQLTNSYNFVMNRGIVRLYARQLATVAQQNGDYKPALMSGSVTLNGDENVNWFLIEVQDSGTLTSSTKQVIFSGPITGAGGFTKKGYSEMALTGTNNFTGRVNINQSFCAGPAGIYGGIALREGGTMTGIEGMTLNRNGNFLIDNSVVNIDERINDNMWLVNRGWTAFQVVGNSNAPTTETIGRVTNKFGHLSFLLDRNFATPQALTLNLAGLARERGSIVSFVARDIAQGVLGTNVNAITVNIADTASLAQVGAGGGAGTTTRSVALGVFGGDAMDFMALDTNKQSNALSRGDEFMTLDGNRLRTLNMQTEVVHLGGRTNLPLAITQASAPADANVNINFMVTNLNMNAAGNLVGGTNNMVSKVVQGAVTFNSIRIGVVSNFLAGTRGAQSDPGATLLISEGGRLTSESGMLLFGRDVANVDGDGRSGANIWIARGTLDLDGTNNNREAIVVNESGQTAYIRSIIEAGSGFTKGGNETLYLDMPNLIAGTVNIARGNVHLRHSGAIGVATQVIVSGRAQLVLESGADIRGADLIIQEPDVSQYVFVANSRVNTWGGNIILKLVDPQGIGDYAPTITSAAEGSTLNILGNIGRDPERLPTADLIMVDAPSIRMGPGSGGVINLRGSVGDFIVNGQAVTYNAALIAGHPRVDYGQFLDRVNDENYVLRVFIDGDGNRGDELSVNIWNPWRAAGRLYADQGVIRYMGDPAAGKGDFFANEVLTNANPDRSSQTGFQLGRGTTDANGHVILLMTQDGQRFNAERWAVSSATEQRLNTIAMGLEHFGPTNATVTIGNDYDDGSISSVDNRITISRELRLFAHNGWDNTAKTSSVGRVDVRMTLVGDTSATLTKIGSGVVYLQAPSNFNYDEHNDVRTNLLLGGELVLDRRPGSFDSTLVRTRNSAANGTVLILGGGDVTMWGSTNLTQEYYSSNLLVRAGDSTIRSRTFSAAGSNVLNIANGAGATIVRQLGGTLSFVKDLSAGGGAGFQLGTVTMGLQPWAVVSSNGLAGAAFAATDSGRWVTPALMNVDSYGAGFHTDVRDSFFAVLTANEQSETLRFDAASGLDLNTFQYTVNQSGILVTPNAINATSNGPAAIVSGTLVSGNGELIVHNYNTAYGFGIGAAITGNVSLTHSGTGNTTLSGANSFTGTVYLNGGTLSIDSAGRLGDTNNTLEMRGGALNMTASMDLGFRTNVLGGDGGIYRVAAGQTVRLSGPIVTETNYFGNTLLNSGHGDFIKEGAGTLILGTKGGAWANTNFNGTYQGLTDIREGTLEIQRQTLSSFSNGVLGSSKSFYDGTIVRGGATLVFAFTNKWDTPDTTVNGSVTNSMPDIREWMIFEQGATVRWEQQGEGYQSSQLSGVLDIRGDTVFSNVADEVLFNGNAGYIMGSGGLIWTRGNAIVYNDNPDFTGKIQILGGTFAVNSIGKWAFDNASRIEMGLGDNVDRGTAHFAFRPEGDGVPTEYNIRQDIFVRGNNLDFRIGYAHSNTHDDSVNLLGKLDLTNFDIYGSGREFKFQTTEGNARSRDAYNGDSLRDDTYISVLGEITGGNKRLRSYIPSAEGTLDVGQVRAPEMGYNFILTFAGTNTGWTGALEVGNRQGTTADAGLDNDKQHIMRFGRDQGLPTWAIGNTNIVVLRHNAQLQAFGSQVTIGTLIADGDSGGDGFWGNQPVTNTWLENGGFNPGTLTIAQISNKVFTGGIRNGEVYTRFMTNSPAAALSFVKAGPASLTLVQSNTYSGLTRIMAGTLALTGTAAIAQSPTIQIDSGAFLNVTGLNAGAMTLASGQTLRGVGTMVGGLIVGSGATVAPGTSPGVLTQTANVTFQSGSTFEAELLGTLAGEADQLLMAGLADTLTLGGATLSVLAPNILPYLSSFTIIDGFSTLDGSRFAGLPTSGSTLTGGVNTFDIQYNANDITLTVIPEPASLGLMGLMGIAGWLLRRRRR